VEQRGLGPPILRRVLRVREHRLDVARDADRVAAVVVRHAAPHRELLLVQHGRDPRAVGGVGLPRPQRAEEATYEMRLTSHHPYLDCMPGAT
jgi:hypothetical protein